MLLELITAAGFLGIYCWETLAGGLLPDFARGLILKPQLQAIVHCQCLAHLVLFSFMMAATWIDIDEKTIPDGITLPGSLLGLILITWLPQALLPDVQVSASGALTIGNVVWLFTPLLPGGRNRLCMPALGHKGLALGLVCIWFWVYAMLPRTWYTRHGLFRAVRLMVARLLRQTMTYVLLLLGVAESVAVYLLWRSPVGPQWFSLLSSLVGMGFGAALVWMVRVLGKWALKREAMGFGDVTLMAMIGVYVGWQPVVLIFFLAPFAGVVIGGANFLLHGEVEIPYGPFLCLATMVTIIGWVPVWDFTVNYFSLG